MIFSADSFSNDLKIGPKVVATIKAVDVVDGRLFPMAVSRPSNVSHSVAEYTLL